jgi:hypothetical protein
MKPGLISFKNKRTQPPWSNNENNSEIEEPMSRLHKHDRSADVAIEKVFVL